MITGSNQSCLPGKTGLIPLFSPRVLWGLIDTQIFEEVMGSQSQCNETILSLPREQIIDKKSGIFRARSKKLTSRGNIVLSRDADNFSILTRARDSATISPHMPHFTDPKILAFSSGSSVTWVMEKIFSAGISRIFLQHFPIVFGTPFLRQVLRYSA